MCKGFFETLQYQESYLVKKDPLIYIIFFFFLHAAPPGHGHVGAKGGSYQP